MKNTDSRNHLEKIKDAIFRMSWERAALKGWCDEVDTAEYRRVLEAWVSSGRPSTVALFIWLEANRGPQEGGQTK